MPGYRVMDIRGERLDGGISKHLHRAIDAHLAAGNQVLAFINRRGYAPVLFCSGCGWQAECGPLRRQAHLPPPAPAIALPPLRPATSDSPRVSLVWRKRFRPSRRRNATHRGNAANAASRRTPVPYRPRHDPERAASRVGPRRHRRRPPGHPRRNADARQGPSPPERHAGGGTRCGWRFPFSGFPRAGTHRPTHRPGCRARGVGATRPGEVWIQTFDPENANLRALIEAGYPGFVDSERRRRASALMPPFVSLAIVRAESPHRGGGSGPAKPGGRHAGRRRARTAGTRAGPDRPACRPLPEPTAAARSGARRDLHRALKPPRRGRTPGPGCTVVDRCRSAGHGMMGVRMVRPLHECADLLAASTIL